MHKPAKTAWVRAVRQASLPCSATAIPVWTVEAMGLDSQAIMNKRAIALTIAHRVNTQPKGAGAAKLVDWILSDRR